MLQNLEDTASELIHYKARTIIEENRGKHKIAHTAFNPRLGKEAKKVVFPGRTAQDLVINPATGGYDLTNCEFFIDPNMEAENTEKKTDSTNTNMNTQQNTSNLSLKNDAEKSQTVTTPGNKKKEKGKKGSGKKRKKKIKTKQMNHQRKNRRYQQKIVWIN